MPRIEDRIAPGIEPLLSVDDLGRLFQVSKNTLYRWTKADRFPQPIRCGRQLRWRASEIRDWLESGGN